VLLQAAVLPQLVEQMLDENFKGTTAHFPLRFPGRQTTLMMVIVAVALAM
jgi:hypothetical protein